MTMIRLYYFRTMDIVIGIRSLEPDGQLCERQMYNINNPQVSYRLSEKAIIYNWNLAVSYSRSSMDVRKRVILWSFCFFFFDDADLLYCPLGMYSLCFV